MRMMNELQNSNNNKYIHGKRRYQRMRSSDYRTSVEKAASKMQITQDAEAQMRCYWKHEAPHAELPPTFKEVRVISDDALYKALTLSV